MFLFYVFLHLFLIAMTLSEAAHAGSTRQYAALVMDADTGRILHEENANTRVYPASLTKMMTLMMTFDSLQRGQLRLSDRIVMSKHAASMVPSKLGLAPGTTISVENAIYALVTKSANDIAVALGERLGGSEENFALMMTRKAQALGMKQTRFKNASGLHDPGQMTTARDMARLSMALVKDYALYYHYFSTANFSYHGRSFHNHNGLMKTYKGMDGIKTGYIVPSGFNLAASAVRNNRRLIGVVFGGRSAASRNAQMAKLLDAGFEKINVPKENSVGMIAKNIPIPARKPAYIARKDMPDATDSTLQVASLVSPQAGQEIFEASRTGTRWDMLNRTSENSIVQRMIGEGDYDDFVRNRIETGLISISAVTGEPILLDGQKTIRAALQSPDKRAPSTAPAATAIKPAVLSASPERDWIIQIGAFTTREGTNKALGTAMRKLPQSLRYASAVIAPLQTGSGWIYRARLTGYSAQEAENACAILNDCLVISP